MCFLAKYEQLLVLFEDKPSSEAVKLWKQIISIDDDLCRYGYLKNNNPSWLNVIVDNGIVSQVENGDTGKEHISFALSYIIRILDNKAELSGEQNAKLVKLINEKLRLDNEIERGKCCRILSMLPKEYAIQCLDYIKYCIDEAYKITQQYLYSSNHIFKYIDTLRDDYTDEMFELSEKILVLADESEWSNVKTKLNSHLFIEFLENQFFDLAQKDIERAVKYLSCLMLDQLEAVNKEYAEGGEDITYYHNYKIADVSNLSYAYRDPLSAIVMCILKLIKECFSIDEAVAARLIDHLQSLDYPIFKSILLVALNDSKEFGEAKEKLNKLFVELFNSKARRGCSNEIDYVLSDSFDIFEDRTKKVYKDYVDNYELPEWTIKSIREHCREKENREAVDEDLDKVLARRKAEALYHIRSNYQDEYDKYKAICGAEDEELKPVKSGVVYSVSHRMSSPISFEKMNNMAFSDIVYFLDHQETWPEVKTRFRDHPVDGVRDVLCDVVKERANEFTNLTIEEIYQIPIKFRDKFLQSVAYNDSFDWQKANDVETYFIIAQKLLDHEKEFSLSIFRNNCFDYIIEIFDKLTKVHGEKASSFFRWGFCA